MAETTVVMTSDEAKLIAGLNKSIAIQEKMLNKFKGVGAAGKEAGKTSEEGMTKTNSVIQQGVKHLTAYALGYVGVQQGINLVNKELQAQIEFQKKIRETNINVAGSQAAIIKNISGASSGTKTNVIKAIEQIQRDTEFPSLPQLNLAGAAGLSASAGDVNATLDAVRQAAFISRDSPDEIGTFVGGALDIRKASGIADARRNLGYLLSVGGEARIESPQLQAKNVAPAVGAIVGTVEGNREQASIEAGALFAALTTAAVDTAGETTRTASVGLAVQLREFFEGRDDPGTLKGRIGSLQENEKLRQEFLGGASFEKRYQIPVEQLLTGGATAQSFEQALTKISFDAAPFEQVKTELKSLTDELRSLSDSGSVKANVENYQLGADLDQRRADARENVAEALGIKYEGKFGQGIFRSANQLEFDVRNSYSSEPEQLAIDTIKKEIDALRRAGLSTFGTQENNELNNEQLRKLEALQESSRILRDRRDAETEISTAANGDRIIQTSETTGVGSRAQFGSPDNPAQPLSSEERTALLRSINRNTQRAAENGQGSFNRGANQFPGTHTEQ